MTTQIEPGVVEVTVVARDSTPAMRVITHLVNTYVTASSLGRGQYTPGCVYRRLRVNTVVPNRVSDLPEDGEPFTGPAHEEPLVAEGQARVHVEGRTRESVEKVAQSLTGAFRELSPLVEVSDYGVPEPRDISFDLLLETAPEN